MLPKAVAYQICLKRKQNKTVSGCTPTDSDAVSQRRGWESIFDPCSLTPAQPSGSVHPVPGMCFHPDSHSSSVFIYLLRKALPDLLTPSATSRAHHSWPCLRTHAHLSTPKRHLVICACCLRVCPTWVREGKPSMQHRKRSSALEPASPKLVASVNSPEV